MRARPKLVVATSFPVHPPRGGGQARVAGLYGALAASGVDVDLVALTDPSERARTVHPSPGLREFRVPMTPAHVGAVAQLQQRTGVPAGDLGLALHHELSPAYGEALAVAASDASAVVACHPYGADAVAAASGLPLVYESQDVEGDLKASMYSASAHAEELTETVRAIEAECCARAHHVTVCADADGVRLDALYGLGATPVVTVPNGADPAAVTYTGPQERRARREALGLGREQLAVFVGSWHEPNLVVVRDLLRLSEDLEGVRVLVLGSAGLAFADKPMPGNFDVCGVVDDAFLADVLSIAHVALNPMTVGSGSNLKMLEYALAGVPIVSTRFGARGLDLEPGRHYIETEVDALPATLASLRAEAEETTAGRVRAIRDHVDAHFSWQSIAAAWRAHPALTELLDRTVVSA
jgi:glycosyltransferase involved in cell wall biosynthesis